MDRIFLCLFLCFLFFTTSCSTPYQSMGFTGGYTETQLSKNVWKVRTDGNAFTSQTVINNYALLRASELTLKKGYKYFAVISEDQTTTTQDIDFGQTSNTYGNISSNGSFNSRTTTNNNVTTFTKHGNTFIFEMLKRNKRGAYDAEIIFSSLGARYLK